MQCHVIILNTTGTTYAFYEIEKRNEAIKEKTKTKKTNGWRRLIKHYILNFASYGICLVYTPFWTEFCKLYDKPFAFFQYMFRTPLSWHVCAFARQLPWRETEVSRARPISSYLVWYIQVYIILYLHYEYVDVFERNSTGACEDQIL